MPFVKTTMNQTTRERKERLAFKEMRRRAKRHEEEQWKLVKQHGSDYVPDVYLIKPRSKERRDLCKKWLSAELFKYVKLCWSSDDFLPVDRDDEIEKKKKEQVRKASGWDPLTHARGPFCHTDNWPWPLLPPFLVSDALQSYAGGIALEVLERDMNIPKSQRFRVEEFLQAAGLDQEFFRASRENALPVLPLDLDTFIAGLRFGCGYKVNQDMPSL